ncbi:MAG: two-component regulator propeller domain-containing protein [Pseudomonadota bacterium]
MAAWATPNGQPLVDHSTQRSVHWQTLAHSAELSQDSVLDVVQDADGFIWFATQAGLNRYDGQRVRVFERSDGGAGALTHNWVWELLVDDEARLWAATNGGGAVRFDARRGQFTALRHDPSDANSLSSDRVRALALDLDGGLWLGTVASGLNHHDPASGRTTRYRHDPRRPRSLPDDAIQTLLVDRTGRLWIGTDGGGLAYLDRESDAFVRDPALADHDVTALLMDATGALWIGTQNDGLYRRKRGAAGGLLAGGLLAGGLLAGGLQKMGGAGDALGSDYVRDIFQDDQGSVWIGTANGIAEWVPGLQGFRPSRSRRADRPADGSGLPGRRINRLYQSRDGVLWVGTNRGAARWNYLSDAFRYLDSEQLGHSDVTALAEGSSGVLWIGTYGGGVARHDRVAGEITRFRHDPGEPQSLSSNRITAMAIAPDGAPWVGTRYRGLNRIDPITGQVQQWRRPELVSDRITAVAPDGAAVWIGTRRGLTRLAPDGRGALVADTLLTNTRIHSLLLDTGGQVWIGTQRSGLLRLSPTTGDLQRYVHSPGSPDSLSSNSIRAIFESRDGSLWIGTASEGLNRWSAADRAAGRTRFSTWLRDDGLASNSIAALTDDNAGNLWIATDRGLNRLRLRNRKPGDRPLVYDDRTGLRGNAFNVGAALHNRTGALFFGTPRGALSFVPRSLTPRRRSGDGVGVALTAIADSRPLARVHSRSRRSQPIARIGYQHRLLEFEFAALDFRTPHRTRFRYRLDGVDADWQDPGKLRRLSYARLPPGNYRLSVQASLQASPGEGEWSDPPAVFAFSITPPPWRTGWAYALYALLFAIAASALRAQRRRRRELELGYQQALEAQVERRTGELDARNRELEALNRRVTAASYTDALTSLYNRRYVDQRLRSGQMVERRGEPTLRFCMMIDLDGFKLINDEHGHAAGDRALLQVRDQLLDATRAGDTVIRWGGDEFLIIGTIASVADLTTFAERIRLVVTQRRYRLGNSQSAELSCSIGAVPLPFTGAPVDADDGPAILGWEQSLMVADAAAYLVKSHGKNGWAVLSAASDFSLEEASRLPQQLEALRAADRVRASLSAGLTLPPPQRAPSSAAG